MEARSSGESGAFTALVTLAFKSAANAVKIVWNAITKDGTVPAFIRQGADEFAAFLRPFPETIHIDEPGTILNPTQGEIQADRSSKPHIADRSNYFKQSDLPSPSEIAQNKQPYVPEQHRGHEHSHDMGRD